jgi:hypothetical protein
MASICFISITSQTVEDSNWIGDSVGQYAKRVPRQFVGAKNYFRIELAVLNRGDMERRQLIGEELLSV